MTKKEIKKLKKNICLISNIDEKKAIVKEVCKLSKIDIHFSSDEDYFKAFEEIKGVILNV